MHYLIWIPDNGESAPKQAVFERVGLADHVDNAEAMPSVGPTGKQGTLFCWRRNGPTDFVFNPNIQDWIQAAAWSDWPQSRYWVGMRIDDPPTTQQLARNYMRAGPTISLGGQTWTVPVAKELPHDAILQDDGSLRFEIQRMYHAYFLRAVEMAKAQEQGTAVGWEQAFHFCVDTLRINYRITPEVASRLRLFNTDSLQEFVALVVGATNG